MKILLLIIPLLFLMSGCASLVVGSVCAVSEKPEEIPSKDYEATISYEMGDIVKSESIQYSCKPNLLECGGGTWRHQYVELSHIEGFSINVREDHRVDISRPQCGYSSKLGSEPGNLKDENAGNIQARVEVGDDLYIFYVSELFQQSSESVTGVKVISYTARQIYK